MADGLMLTPENACRVRGVTAARNRANAAVFCVSGEYVTRVKIAERLGIGASAAAHRLKAARAKHGTRLTWEMLA